MSFLVTRILFVVCATFAVSLKVAADVPNVFQNGLPALAEQVNENFSDLDARLASLASRQSGDVYREEVNCDLNPSAMWDTLQRERGWRVIAITFSGTCRSGNFISTGDAEFVILAGSEKATAVIEDPIFVSSGSIMNIRDATLRPDVGGAAVEAASSAILTLSSVNVAPVQGGTAVVIRDNSLGSIVDSTVSTGSVAIQRNSSVRFLGSSNTIEAGSLTVAQGSTVESGSSLVLNTGPQLLNLAVTDGSNFIANGDITGTFRLTVSGVSKFQNNGANLNFTGLIQVAEGSHFSSLRSGGLTINRYKSQSSDGGQDYCCNGWGILVTESSARIEHDLRFPGFTLNDQVMQAINGSSLLIASSAAESIPRLWVFDSSTAKLSGASFDVLEVKAASSANLNQVRVKQSLQVAQNSSADISQSSGDASIAVHSSFVNLYDLIGFQLNQISCAGASTLDLAGQQLDGTATNCLDTSAWARLLTAAYP